MSIVITKEHMLKAIEYLKEDRSSYCCNCLALAMYGEGVHYYDREDAAAFFLHPRLVAAGYKTNGNWRNAPSEFMDYKEWHEACHNERLAFMEGVLASM